MQGVPSGATERALPAPATLIALFAAAQIVAWTLAPALTHTASPLDVVEGYMWGREWVIATYKHPALPSWFLEASRILTSGATGWPAYLVSQLFIAATFGLVFLLGRDMMGAKRGAAGTLLLAGVTYYAWPSVEFNHNIAAAPFWAGVALALWRAVERRSLVWWGLLGAFAAGALYAKLSAVLILFPAAAWILLDARARACLATAGPWLGLAVFAIAAWPLVAWLVAHEFAPLTHAAQRSALRSAAYIPTFLLDTLANVAGIPIMLTVAGLIGPWRAQPPEPMLSQPSAGIDPHAMRFLLILTCAPLAIALAAAAISHAGLKTAWGSSMFNLAGLLAIALTADRMTSAAFKRITLSAALLIVVVPLGYAATVKFANQRSSGVGVRANWPQRAIAERLGGIWARESGQPLRIVAGDPWIAGLVGVSNRGVPSILTNGDMSLSPWVTLSRIDREGMLIVWDSGIRGLPPSLQPLVASSKTGEERFSFIHGKAKRELVIGYAVVPPARRSLVD
jgi:4-amino-4-deoxy-L-arabinose transferase-like glycosyltransferase